MTQPISLKSFVRSPADDDYANSNQLSSLHTASIPQWQAAAVRIAEQLSETLQKPSDCDVEISIIEHRTLREDGGDAGLLIPLVPEASGAFVRLPGASAQILSSLLLFDIASSEEAAVADEVDAELAAEIIELISSTLTEALGLSIKRAQTDHATDWPLTPPPLGPRLLAEFNLSFGTDQNAALQVVFPTLEEEAMNRLSGSANTVDPALVVLEAEATVARWRIRTDELSDLKVGAKIALPGGNKTAIGLEATSDGEHRFLGKGTLGAAHGRRTLTFNG